MLSYNVVPPDADRHAPERFIHTTLLHTWHIKDRHFWKKTNVIVLQKEGWGQFDRFLLLSKKKNVHWVAESNRFKKNHSKIVLDRTMLLALMTLMRLCKPWTSLLLSYTAYNGTLAEKQLGRELSVFYSSAVAAVGGWKYIVSTTDNYRLLSLLFYQQVKNSCGHSVISFPSRPTSVGREFFVTKANAKPVNLTR